MGRPRATPMAAGSGTPACSSMCSGLMTVAAVSALVERVGWSLQWLHGWSVHSIDVDRVTTADDWQASWLSQGVQKSIVNLSAACIDSSHPPGCRSPVSRRLVTKTVDQTHGADSRARRSRRRRCPMGRCSVYTETGKLTVIFDYRLDGSVIR